jgi:NodT family efflux transporter outer membrane factor (OMF) lipoprotein
MNGRVLRLATLAACACAASACIVVPTPSVEDLRKQSLENTQVPPAWVAGPVNTTEPTEGWLATFGEPALEALVAEAMIYNSDLRVAAARVEAAAANAQMAGAALFPQVNAAGRGGGKMSGDNSGLQGVGIFASWELDVWARVRSLRASGTETYEATVLDAYYARQSIAALVAKSWFLAREAALQRRIAEEMVGSARSLAGLARDRLQVGRADELEVNQADASVLSYRDIALQAELARQNALRAIETLAGRYPSAAVAVGEGLPTLAAPVPAGLPSQLLERRPDVRAAERRVAAAFHRTQEAQAARLPRISLTGGVTSVSSDLFVLKERDNPIWSVGASILAPIFMGGALQAQVDVRTAEQHAAIAEFGRIGSRAFNEVEGALSASFNLEERTQVLTGAVASNERALGFARVRLDVGSGDQRGVQEQLLALHAARTTLLRVQAERLIQRVNLYLALGGGFEPPKQ